MKLFDLIPRDRYAHDFEIVLVKMLEAPILSWTHPECTKAVSFVGEKSEEVVVWYFENTILVLGEKPF